MWINPNYLYFDEGEASRTTATAMVKKSTQFLGCFPSAVNKTKVLFEPTTIDETKFDVVELTHSQGGHKEVMRAIAAAVSDPRGKFIDVANVRTGVFWPCPKAPANTTNLAAATEAARLIAISDCEVTITQ